MNTNLAVAPFFIPLFTALILLAVSRYVILRNMILWFSVSLQMLIAGKLIVLTKGGERIILSLGDWAPPFGIVIVIDLLSAIMIALSSLLLFFCVAYSQVSSESKNEHPLRRVLLQFLVSGTHLSFLTGDLFNLFVAFEILLLSSYALLTLEIPNRKVFYAYPYILTNLVGSLLFLCFIALIYGAVGSLNFAKISQYLHATQETWHLNLLGLFAIFIFGIKAGLFPLYFWLPISYPTLSTPVAAFYSGMLTKVGVYVFLRLFGTVFPPHLEFLHNFIAWIAIFTMIFGVIGAISRNVIQEILSYHILSQVGFMMLAIGLFGANAFAACIFYMIHHILVKSSLFLIGGVIQLFTQKEDLKEMGNLWKEKPLLGLIFGVQALALIGFPPLSGFWGKLLVMRSCIEKQEFIWLSFTVLGSLLTLISMLKIWNNAFWKESPNLKIQTSTPRTTLLLFICSFFVFFNILIAWNIEYIFHLATVAASSCLDSTSYVQSVLTSGGKS